MKTAFDPLLLSRIEDAAINASAPPQQRWLDGWIIRTHPGKARRARCIHAVAPGRLPLAEKLGLAQAIYDTAQLPLGFRITPFSEPATLDAALATAGWAAEDETQVLLCPLMTSAESRHPDPPAPPAGLSWQTLDAETYAATVGRLRGSSASQQSAHAERIRMSPVPYQGYALASSDGTVLACGQTARECAFVGLYDVHTHPQARNQGLARWLCERMLQLAAAEGATVAYLQVEAGNQAAQAVYRRLGFSYGYSYHYRLPPGGA